MYFNALGTLYHSGSQINICSLRKSQVCTIKKINTTNTTNNTLLIGNGFSLYFHNIFRWEKLISDNDGSLKTASVMLGSNNLEKMIEYLICGKLIIPFLVNGDETLKKNYNDVLKKEIETLKKLFIENLGKKHPSLPKELELKNKQCVTNTLKSFQNIFTTNYDLVLYWLIIDSVSHFCDGFSCSISDNKNNYFSHFHNYATRKNKIPISYLHGALHLYHNELGTHKITYKPEETLVQKIQVMDNLPLVILEGNSTDKIKQISDNFYLQYSHNQLKEIKGNVYTFGVSFEHDDYIIKSLCENSKIDKIYFGDYKDIPVLPKHLLKYSDRINLYSSKFFGFNDDSCEIS